jgi:hypothetical protein
MSSEDQEVMNLRDRIRRLKETLSRLNRPVPAPPALLCQVKDLGHMPTTLPGEFAVTPVTVGGGTTEGGAYAVTPRSGTGFVTVIGNRVPAAGDVLLARLCGRRWAAESRGGSRCTLVVTAAGLCGGISGATVTVFRNVSTLGAFLDPASNDTTVATGTTNASGVYSVSVPVGIVMVRVVAAGYDTTYQFVYACVGCVALFPKFAPAQTCAIDAGGQTTSLVASHVDVLGVGTDILANNGAKTYASIPSSLVTFVGYGLATQCTDSTGVRVVFYTGCIADGGNLGVFYEVPVVLCSSSGGTHPVYHMTFRDPNSTTSTGVVGTLRVTGTVTSIETSPFRVMGTWSADYTYFRFDPVAATYAGGSGPGDPRDGANPIFGLPVDGPGPPITGPFVIS